MAELWDFLSLFPAHAGVILGTSEPYDIYISFPRTRGGDPYGPAYSIINDNFSPHTRG